MQIRKPFQPVIKEDNVSNVSVIYNDQQKSIPPNHRW